MATTMTLQAGLPAEELVKDPGVPEVPLEGHSQQPGELGRIPS